MDKINYSYFLTDQDIASLIRMVDIDCVIGSISSNIDDSEGTRVYVNVQKDDKANNGYMCILNNCSMTFLFYPKRLTESVKNFDQHKYIRYLYNHLDKYASDFKNAYINERAQNLWNDFRDKPSKLTDYLLDSAVDKQGGKGIDAKELKKILSFDYIKSLIERLDEASKKSLLLGAVIKEIDDILNEKVHSSEPNND